MKTIRLTREFLEDAMGLSQQDATIKQMRIEPGDILALDINVDFAADQSNDCSVTLQSCDKLKIVADVS